MKKSIIRRIAAICLLALMAVVLSNINPSEFGSIADAAIVSKSKEFGISANCGKAMAHKVIEKTVRVPRAKLRARASCSAAAAVRVHAAPSCAASAMRTSRIVVRTRAVAAGVCACGAGCPGGGVCACGCR